MGSLEPTFGVTTVLTGLSASSCALLSSMSVWSSESVSPIGASLPISSEGKAATGGRTGGGSLASSQGAWGALSDGVGSAASSQGAWGASSGADEDGVSVFVACASAGLRASLGSETAADPACGAECTFDFAGTGEVAVVSAAACIRARPSRSARSCCVAGIGPSAEVNNEDGSFPKLLRSSE